MDPAGLTARRFSPGECPRLIVKIGSSLLVAGDATIRRAWLTTLVGDIAERRAAGQQIIIVSSGSIALGARRLGLDDGGRGSLEDAQAAAAVGQIGLSQCWAELLAAQDVIAAQMLVTLEDLEDRRRYLNASATFDRLLSLGALPVVNENDSVATEEIRFGDNDRLAARVGQAAGAEGVILLSDVAGLHATDPRQDPNAALIPVVDAIDANILAMAENETGTAMGSGGMASKIEAARIATAAGIPLAITSGQPDHPLLAFDDTSQGTVFSAEKTPSARDRWLAGRLKTEGQVTIDEGAAKALGNGNSLLPAGVADVSGDFDRGAVIDIADANGVIIGRGLAEYSSDDSALIIGRKSAELEAILGYAPRSALVHRNHMILL